MVHELWQLLMNRDSFHWLLQDGYWWFVVIRHYQTYVLDIPFHTIRDDTWTVHQPHELTVSESSISTLESTKLIHLSGISAGWRCEPYHLDSHYRWSITLQSGSVDCNNLDFLNNWARSCAASFWNAERLVKSPSVAQCFQSLQSWLCNLPDFWFGVCNGSAMVWLTNVFNVPFFCDRGQLL